MEFPWINEAIAAVPGGYAPELPPVGEDEVVGTVPEHLRPLFLAFVHIGDTVREKHDAHCAEKGEHNEEKRASHGREMLDLILQRDVLKSLFFRTLETELDLDPEANHGVCENWQVVSIKKVEKPVSGPDIIIIGAFGGPNSGSDGEPGTLAEHLDRVFGG